MKNNILKFVFVLCAFTTSLFPMRKPDSLPANQYTPTMIAFYTQATNFCSLDMRNQYLAHTGGKRDYAKFLDNQLQKLEMIVRPVPPNAHNTMAESIKVMRVIKNNLLNDAFDQNIYYYYIETLGMHMVDIAEFILTDALKQRYSDIFAQLMAGLPVLELYRELHIMMHTNFSHDNSSQLPTCSLWKY